MHESFLNKLLEKENVSFGSIIIYPKVFISSDAAPSSVNWFKLTIVIGYILSCLDTVTELTVEESPLEATFSGPDDITSGPGALSDGDDDKDADVMTDSINAKMTPKTTAKRKTPLSKVGHGLL